MNEVADAKAYWSKNHLQGAQLIREGHEHRWRLAEIVASHEPSSVLEFGCSSGRNLAVLREVMGPGVELTGLDMNETTLRRAREAHPDMTWVLADEASLPPWRDGRFDVVLTSSVLDHIPHPHWKLVYDDLVRLAWKAVVLHEPVLRAEYTTDAMANSRRNGDGEGWQEMDCAALGIATTPHSWLHNYLGHDPALRVVAPLPVQQTAEYAEFGRLYVVMERSK